MLFFFSDNIRDSDSPTWAIVEPYNRVRMCSRNLLHEDNHCYRFKSKCYKYTCKVLKIMIKWTTSCRVCFMADIGSGAWLQLGKRVCHYLTPKVLFQRRSARDVVPGGQAEHLPRKHTHAHQRHHVTRVTRRRRNFLI